tara:strand:- start:2592 stop:2888 length:297 start_codon:yes stop_codon:yes gene_type:complete
MSKRETAIDTKQYTGLDVHHWNKNISVDVTFNTKDVGFGGGELTYTGSKLLSKDDQLERIYHQLKEQRNQLDNAIKQIDETYGRFIYTDKDTTKEEVV